MMPSVVVRRSRGVMADTLYVQTAFYLPSELQFPLVVSRLGPSARRMWGQHDAELILKATGAARFDGRRDHRTEPTDEDEPVPGRHRRQRSPEARTDPLERVVQREVSEARGRAERVGAVRRRLP